MYETNCASCHGATGAGDGAAGRTLSPPPGNLAWLAQMPMVDWDPFMYWTVAEGGTQFGSAMPAFKDRLSKDDIWAVIAYIQARLPQELSNGARETGVTLSILRLPKRESDAKEPRASQSQQTNCKEAIAPLHALLSAAATLCNGDCRKSDR